MYNEHIDKMDRSKKSNLDIPKDIIERYDDWDYYKLSKNPNITLDYIGANIDENWNFHTLSNHPNMTFEFISNHAVYN